MQIGTAAESGASPEAGRRRKAARDSGAGVATPKTAAGKVAAAESCVPSAESASPKVATTTVAAAMLRPRGHSQENEESERRDGSHPTHTDTL